MPFIARFAGNSERRELIDTSLTAFRIWFVLGTFLSVGYLPTMIYGVLLGQWGTNLVWGSVYGLGWCLAAYAFEGQVGWILGIGLIWSALIVPATLYFGSGWLWQACNGTARRIVIIALFLTLAADIPASAILWLDQYLAHLPDLMLHVATLY